MTKSAHPGETVLGMPHPILGSTFWLNFGTWTFFIEFSLNFGVGGDRGHGSRWGSGAVTSDKMGTPGGNSAGRATPDLGFIFLVDFWHKDVVHGIKFEFLCWR